MSAGGGVQRRKEVWRPVGGEDKPPSAEAASSMPYPAPQGGNSGSNPVFGPRYGHGRGGMGSGSGAGTSQGRGAYGQRRPQGYIRGGYGQYSAPPAPSPYYGDVGYYNIASDRSQGYSQYNQNNQQYNPYFPSRQSQDYRGSRGGSFDRRPNARVQQNGRGDVTVQASAQGDGDYSSEQASSSMTEEDPNDGSQHATVNGPQDTDQRQFLEGSSQQSQFAEQQQLTDLQDLQQDPIEALRQDDLPGSVSQQAKHAVSQLHSASSPPTRRWGDDSPVQGSPDLLQGEHLPSGTGLVFGSAQVAQSETPQVDAGSQRPSLEPKASSRAASPEVMSRDAESAEPDRSWQLQQDDDEEAPEREQLPQHQDATALGEGGSLGALQQADSAPQGGAGAGRDASLVDAVLQQEQVQGSELRLLEAYSEVPDDELVRLAAASALLRAQALREETERAAVFLARREVRRAQAALDQAHQELDEREAELQNRCSEAERRTLEREQLSARLQERVEALEKELVAHRQETQEEAWQKEGQLREKVTEAEALRKERDGALAESKAQASQLEAERAQLKARIDQMEAQVAAKERQIQDISDQLRSVQEELWRKDEAAAQQAQTWAAHGQDMETHAAAMASLNQGLHGELRERTEQCNQLFLANQQIRQQLLDSEQYHVQIIQQLQKEIADLKGRPVNPTGQELPAHQHGQQEDQQEQQHRQREEEHGEGQAREDSSQSVSAPNGGPVSEDGSGAPRGGAPPLLPPGIPLAPLLGPGVPQPLPLPAAGTMGAPFGVVVPPPVSLPIAPVAGIPSAIGPSGSGHASPAPSPFFGAMEYGTLAFSGATPALVMQPAGMPVAPRLAPAGYGMHGAPGDKGPSSTDPRTAPIGKTMSSGSDSGSDSGKRDTHAGPIHMAPGPLPPGPPPPALVVPPVAFAPHQHAAGFVGYTVPPGFPPAVATLGLAGPPSVPSPQVGLPLMPAAGVNESPADTTAPHAPPAVPMSAGGPPGFGPPGRSPVPISAISPGVPAGPQAKADKGPHKAQGPEPQSSKDGEKQGAARNNLTGSGEQENEHGPLPSSEFENQQHHQLPSQQQPQQQPSPQQQRKPQQFLQQQQQQPHLPPGSPLQFGTLQQTRQTGSGPGDHANIAPGSHHASPAKLVVSPPRLLDERSLVTCLVRTLGGQGIKLPISSTVSLRLARLLAPLSWDDYKPRFGELGHFIESHPELFQMDGSDLVSLREGAHAVVASMPLPQAGAPGALPAQDSSAAPANTSNRKGAESLSKLPEVSMAVTPLAVPSGATATTSQAQGKGLGAPAQGNAGHSGMLGASTTSSSSIPPSMATGMAPGGGGPGPAPHLYYNRQHGNTRGPIGQNYTKRPHSNSGNAPQLEPQGASNGQYSLYGNGHYPNSPS